MHIYDERMIHHLVLCPELKSHRDSFTSRLAKLYSGSSRLFAPSELCQFILNGPPHQVTHACHICMEEMEISWLCILKVTNVKTSFYPELRGAPIVEKTTRQPDRPAAISNKPIHTTSFNT